MSKIIAVTNQKGGVGKTTTSVNLSAALAESGKKVLLIDIDPQGNATSGVGIQNKNNLELTIYNLLMGECYVEETLQKTCVENLLVIPSNINLAGAELELADMPQREYILKKIVDNLKFLYDFVIIDCPPSLSMLTINALTSADSVLIPVQCEYFALEGLTQLMHTIKLVQNKINDSLIIEGIVFTMFDSRLNLSLQVVDEVKKHLGQYVFTSMIPRNVRLSEAPSHGLPVTVYDKTSKGAESYYCLAEEIIKKNK